MKKLFCLLSLSLLVSACGDNDHWAGAELVGSWTFTHGEGHYFCDDGQAGGLTTNRATFDIDWEDRPEDAYNTRLRTIYRGQCPDGFIYAKGDEDSEGWISQASQCRYSDRNAFGAIEVTMTNTSDSSLYLDPRYDDILVVKDEQVYKFDYTEYGTVQICNLFALSYAERTGRD